MIAAFSNGLPTFCGSSSMCVPTRVLRLPLPACPQGGKQAMPAHFAGSSKQLSCVGARVWEVWVGIGGGGWSWTGDEAGQNQLNLGHSVGGKGAVRSFLVERWVSAPPPASFSKTSLPSTAVSEGYKHRRAHSALFTTRRLSVQTAGQY